MNIMYKIQNTYKLLLDKNLPAARSEFIQIIDFFGKNYKTNKKHCFNIFFDGGETRLDFNYASNIQIHYSYDGKKADDEIINFIKKTDNRQELCIVSSDNKIKIGARRSKCSHWLSEQFVNEFLNLYQKFSFSPSIYKNPDTLQKFNYFQKENKDKKYIEQEEKHQTPIKTFKKTPTPTFNSSDKKDLSFLQKNHQKPIRKSRYSSFRPDIDPDVSCSPQEVKEYMKIFQKKKR